MEILRLPVIMTFFKQNLLHVIQNAFKHKASFLKICCRCFEVCLTNEAEDKCQCSLAASAAPRKPLLCTTKQYFHCFMPVLFSDNNSNLVDTCKQKCPSPCSFWQYTKSVSYTRFPSLEARFFVSNQSEWDLLTHTIILEVQNNSHFMPHAQSNAVFRPRDFRLFSLLFLDS
jgi:hypothetical protein